MRTPSLLVAVLTASLLAPATAGASTFLSLLPVGQGTTAALPDFAQQTATGAPPPAFVNQRAMFEALLPTGSQMDDGDLPRYFKAAPLEPPKAPASSATPRAGVTIARDGYGVPYVTGATRGDTMFGAGYAEAQDRLFFMDVLRHTAQGRVTELIGPGVDGVNVKADAAQLQVTDYTDAELQAALTEGAADTPVGRQVAQDVRDYTDGVNAFIAEVRGDASREPAEYALLGKPLADWRPIDTVSILGLLNGYYGLGGGKEVEVGAALQEAVKRFGARQGRQVLDDLRHRDDPEAPTVVTQRFPFDDPGPVRRSAVALPDAGSVRAEDPGAEEPAPGAPTGRVLPDGLRLKRHASNAMLVAARYAVGGRSMLVAGPQVGFYAPAILDEVVLRGPGIEVRGAAVPGAGLYPIAGRGRDFAWSVTTAQGDNTDVFAERLCEPDGSTPTLRSQHYRRGARCVPFSVQRRPLSWSPGPADLLPGGRTTPYATTLTVRRSVHGPLVSRGTVRGVPVAFARDRASYGNEVPAALGLSLLTSGSLGSPAAFQRAIAQVSGSYNWFYADAKHIAYVQSGIYPRRAKGTDPDLPTWGDGRFDWRGVLPYRALPKGVDPRRGYLISWNQKQAPGWRASDADWEYGPVHRSQRLERRVRTAVRTGDRKVGLGELAAIMGDAGTVDLRGQEVLPWLLRVLRTGDVPADLQPAVARLRAWVASGAHRRDADRDGAYDDSAAVKLMDTWWTPFVRAVYEPVLGRPLLDAVARLNQIDYLPKDGPDTFFYGWYGDVQKDLRTVLRRKVRGRLSRRYCGRGSLARCRAIVRSTLADAVKAVGDLDAVRVAPTCAEAVPQTCDQLQFTAAGATTVAPTPWQDRGSFQQVVQP